MLSRACRPAAQHRQRRLTLPPHPHFRSFAFIEFSTETEAVAAIQKANGYKLDKSHTFVVSSFDVSRRASADGCLPSTRPCYP